MEYNPTDRSLSKVVCNCIADMKTVDMTSPHQCGDFLLKFDTDGSLIQLKDPSGKVQYFTHTLTIFSQ